VLPSTDATEVDVAATEAKSDAPAESVGDEPNVALDPEQRPMIARVDPPSASEFETSAVPLLTDTTEVDMPVTEAKLDVPAESGDDEHHVALGPEQRPMIARVDPSASEFETPAVPLLTDTNEVDMPVTEAKPVAPAESGDDEPNVALDPEPRPILARVDLPHRVEPTAPRSQPRYTRFSVSLQIGRGFPELVTLVRASAEGHSDVVQKSSVSIAGHILRGACDRSRDRHLRPLLDHQQRTHSLHEPRPPRRRPASLRTKTPGRRKRPAAAAAAAAAAAGTQQSNVKNLTMASERAS
jgi:hypothetical protein